MKLLVEYRSNLLTLSYFSLTISCIQLDTFEFYVALSIDTLVNTVGGTLSVIRIWIGYILITFCEQENLRFFSRRHFV